MTCCARDGRRGALRSSRPDGPLSTRGRRWRRRSRRGRRRWVERRVTRGRGRSLRRTIRAIDLSGGKAARPLKRPGRKSRANARHRGHRNSEAASLYLGAWTIRWRSRAVWSGGHACLYSGVAVAQQSVVSAIIRSGGAPYNGVSWGWRRAIRIYWTGRTGDGDPCSCRGLLTPHLRPRTDARRATARTHACNTRQSERPATRMVECDAQRCDPPPAPHPPPPTGPRTGTAP